MRSEIIQELLKTALNFQSRLEDLLDHQIHKVENQPEDTEPAPDALKTLAKLGQIYRAQVSVCMRLAREHEKAAPKAEAKEGMEAGWPEPETAVTSATGQVSSPAPKQKTEAQQAQTKTDSPGPKPPASPALRMASMPIPAGVSVGQPHAWAPR